MNTGQFPAAPPACAGCAKLDERITAVSRRITEIAEVQAHMQGARRVLIWLAGVLVTLALVVGGWAYSGDRNQALALDRLQVAVEHNERKIASAVEQNQRVLHEWKSSLIDATASATEAAKQANATLAEAMKRLK